MASRCIGVQNRPDFLQKSVHRSILLQKFYENRRPNLQLDDIVSHVIEFAKDHTGSQFIQKQLDDATNDQKVAIFNELKPQLCSLIMDPCANFVIQKFIGTEYPLQKHQIFVEICKHFLLFSMNKYGCRVVQKMIENSQTLQQAFLLQDYLFIHIAPKIVDLCKNLYGCRVIQTILTNGTQQQQTAILTVIRPHILDLAEHRYGNYVISHALKYCPGTNHLIELILKHVELLSMQKYSSNVVEKCLNIASDVWIEYAFMQICARSDRDIKLLCVDPYANYVIQNLVQCVRQELVVVIYQRLKPYFSELSALICGRKIISVMLDRLDLDLI